MHFFRRHPRRTIALGILVAWILTFQARPFIVGLFNVGSAASRECILISTASGQHYSLSYNHRDCNAKGYTPLPPAQYNALATWTFNTTMSGVMSRFQNFQINARLATVDDSLTRYPILNPHSGIILNPMYEWSEHALMAYYSALQSARVAPPIARKLAASLSLASLASGTKDKVEVRNRRRWPWVTFGVVHIFARAEDKLAQVPEMRRAQFTVEESANQVPKYAEKRREVLGEFVVDSVAGTRGR